MKRLQLLANIIVAVVLTIILAFYRGIFYVLGLILQPIAIKFAKEDHRNEKPFSQHTEHGVWYLWTAPKWLLRLGVHSVWYARYMEGLWCNSGVAHPLPKRGWLQRKQRSDTLTAISILYASGGTDVLEQG